MQPLNTPCSPGFRDHDLLVDRKAKIEKSLQGRFDGSADFTQRQAGDLLMQDNPAAEVVLKRYVEARLSGFEPYREYLDLMVSQGRYAEGYKMVLRHPEFDQEAHGNRVAASNYAGGAAYSSGAPENSNSPCHCWNDRRATTPDRMCL